MKKTTTAVSVKVAPAARHNSLLFAVLPLSLLLIGTGLVPLLTHQQPKADTAPVIAKGISMESELSAPTHRWLKDKHRMVALDTVDRLETEIRQTGGKATISAVDLRLLRSALRQSE
jgi:hypothetical protein